LRTPSSSSFPPSVCNTHGYREGLVDPRLEPFFSMSRESAASTSVLSFSGFSSERILDEKVELLFSKAKNFVRALITRSTILSLLPLLLWWMIFQLNIYVPFHLRPTIHIHLLPWLEETFFGMPGISRIVIELYLLLTFLINCRSLSPFSAHRFNSLLRPACGCCVWRSFHCSMVVLLLPLAHFQTVNGLCP
jgi:hypothetical protein